MSNKDRLIFWCAWAFVALFVRLLTPTWAIFGYIMVGIFIIFMMGGTVGYFVGRSDGRATAKGIEPPDDPAGNTNLERREYLKL